jgi:hypothetical protein
MRLVTPVARLAPTQFWNEADQKVVEWMKNI